MAWCQVNMERVGEAEKMQIHTEVDILKSLTHNLHRNRKAMHSRRIVMLVRSLRYPIELLQ